MLSTCQDDMIAYLDAGDQLFLFLWRCRCGRMRRKYIITNISAIMMKVLDPPPGGGLPVGA